MLKIKLRGLLFAALFAALTGVIAIIKIPLPFTPVPITLQTVMVLLSGALLGSNLGALSQILYVLLGIIGLPIFAGGSSGLGVLFGPTGGYLVGFIIAAFVVGKLVKKSYLSIIFAMAIATIIIYISGVIGALIVTKLSLSKIIVGWVLPFIIGDIIKLFIAASIAYKVDIKKYLAI